MLFDVILIFVFNAMEKKIIECSSKKQISKIIVLFFYCLSYEGTPMRWTNNTMNEFDITMSSLNTRRRSFISVMTVNECIFLHIF